MSSLSATGHRPRSNDAPTVGAFGERLPLTLSVERAAGIVGVSRTAMYAAVRRGDFESIRVNGRVAVLTVPLLRRIGVDAVLEPPASPPQ